MEEYGTSENQLTIFYNPADAKQQKLLAYAKSIGKAVQAIAYGDAPKAYNVWTKIFESLPFPPDQFFDKTDDRFPEIDTDGITDFEGWRNIAIHEPSLINVAVAISGDKMLIINSKNDLYQFEESGETEIAKENRKQD